MPPLFGQLDPAQHAKGIIEYGWIYAAVLLIMILAGVVGVLFNRLTTERDKRLEDMKGHAAHVETLLKSHMDLTRQKDDQQTAILEGIYEALAGRGPKVLPPSRREGKS